MGDGLEKPTKGSKWPRTAFFRKNDGSVAPNDAMKWVDANLDGIKEASRPVLAQFSERFVNAYVRTVVRDEIQVQQDSPMLSPTLRPRGRGRRFVGDQAIAPHREGWLKKKGDNRIGLRRWQLRYFVLSNKALVYRKPKNRGDTSEVPHESSKSTPVSLSGCRVFVREAYESRASMVARTKAEKMRKRGESGGSVPQPQLNQHLVCLQQPHNGRTYLLQAESSEDAREWVVALRKTIQMLPRAQRTSEDGAVVRAVWMAYRAWCEEQLDMPSTRIASPREAFLNVVLNDTRVQDLHVPQLDELFAEMAAGGVPDETIKVYRRKTTQAIVKALSDECRSVWVRTCRQLQGVVPIVRGTMEAHLAQVCAMRAAFDAAVATELSESLRPLCAAIAAFGDRFGTVAEIAVGRYVADFCTDGAALKAKFDEVVLGEAAAADPSRAYFSSNLSREVERFVQVYACRGMKLPFLVGSLLETGDTGVSTATPAASVATAGPVPLRSGSSISSISSNNAEATADTDGHFFSVKGGASLDNMHRHDAQPRQQGGHGLASAGWCQLVTDVTVESFKFLGEARTYGGQHNEAGVRSAVLAMVNPKEVSQAVARLLQFRNVVAKQDSSVPKAAIVQEWMVTVDYTFDLLKDEIEEGEEPGRVQLEKRCSKKPAAGVLIPVDAMLALSKMLGKFSEGLDTGFTVLERDFCSAIGVTVHDCGLEYQGAHGTVSRDAMLEAFDTAVANALRSYMHSLGLSLGSTLFEVTTHVLCALVCARVQTRADAAGRELNKLKQSIARALTAPATVASSTQIPEVLKTYMPSSILVLEAVRRVIAAEMQRSFDKIRDRLASLPADGISRDDIERAAAMGDTTASPTSASVASSSRTLWPDGVSALELRYVHGDSSDDIEVDHHVAVINDGQGDSSDSDDSVGEHETDSSSDDE